MTLDGVIDRLQGKSMEIGYCAICSNVGQYSPSSLGFDFDLISGK